MSFNLLLLAQEDLNPAAAAGVIGILGAYLFCIFIFLAIAFIPIIAMLAGMWKVFEKAGQPGWAAIVPIYNMYVLNEIAGKDVMWFILCLVPCVQIVAQIVICMDLAKNFGKDPAYGVGLALLGFIFFPILGFSDAQYRPMRHY
jgi:hypothetical protein